MTAFTHLEPGTAESVWTGDERLLDAPPLSDQVSEDTDLIVVAAHPDDETLGAGGLIARMHAQGGAVTVIVATDGEASHPESTTYSADRLAGLRRVEVARAVHELAPGARLYFLGLPDGGLGEHSQRLTGEVSAAIESASRQPGRDVLIVAPWSGDSHRDHRIAAEAVAVSVHAASAQRKASGGRGIRHLGYPIWLWHWGTPDDVPWELARSLALTNTERALKNAAMVAHVSQMRPLSSAIGDEAVVHDRMQEHFDRPVEIYFDEAGGEPDSLRAPFFDAFYARNVDPWGFETRWYEERKRDILLASLPDARLGSVLEIGCATGLVTERLAPRANRVVSIDPARAAIEKARSREGVDARVSFIQGSIPAAWPAGHFDTIVLSEVGYYLSPADLAVTIECIESALSATGCLVACHWRHPVAEYPLSGDDVHRALRAQPGWEVLVRHEERDFVLEVFVRRPAQSVAEREGLR